MLEIDVAAHVSLILTTQVVFTQNLIVLTALCQQATRVATLLHADALLQIV